MFFYKLVFFKNIFYIKNFFWKKLICEKTPSLSKKMMIYHKMPMSGVYENVFQTSEISILLSLRIELLFTICVRIPCSQKSTQEEAEEICLFWHKLVLNIDNCVCRNLDVYFSNHWYCILYFKDVRHKKSSCPFRI